MNERMVLSEEGLYDILSFLVTSAHLCVQEPRLYGTFRLMDAAIRLIDLSLENGGIGEDQFLSRFRAEAKEGTGLMMVDEAAYISFLEHATRTLAQEMKRRANV